MSRHVPGGTTKHGTRPTRRSGSRPHALTARGLFALPLLLALALSSLVVVVAAPQPVTAAGTYFTEGFGSGFGPNLTSITGTPSVGGGVVTMPSRDNNVVRTADSDYQTDSFCAEVTVVDYVGGGDNRAYLGFGPGNLAGTDGDFPQAGPAVVLRSVGQFGGSFADSLTLLTSPAPGGTGIEIPNIGGLGLGTGPYTLQLDYDVFAEEVRVAVDGSQFGQTVDVSGYDFTGNGRIFFAGQGVTFDDFSVQFGPCSLTPRTFTVDTTADTVPGSLPVTVDGVCDDGFGLCRIREAILEANAFGGIDTIAFDIDGTGPHTIAPRVALPTITDSVIIDGYTQPDATPNTLADGNDADIRIELTGDVINGVALDLTATDQSVVRGLAINQFNGGGATAIAAGPGTVIEGNFIGTDVTGTTAIPNWDGIVVSDAGGVTIGGPDPAQRNLISGNAQSAIAILSDSDEVTVEGNFLGTDVSGNASIPNRVGVFVDGGPGATEFLSVRDNVISGNNFEGVALQGETQFSTLIGNKIGVGADAVAPVGNNRAGGSGGISINTASDVQIGRDVDGQRNVIGYNANGVIAFSGVRISIVGNEFVSNTLQAISLAGADTNDADDLDSPRASSNELSSPANYGQNSPELARVAIAPNGDLGVEYSIDSLVTESEYPISIDFYVADTSSSGEGRTLIGTALAAAPGPGASNLGNAGILGVAPGEAIVAMATDAEGNSSPFSPVAFVDDVEKVTVGSDGDRVGQAVALDGNRMAVSAPNADVGAADAGAVYVYDRADASSPWALTATIPSPAPEVDGRFGDALDLRGDLLAVGESDRFGDSAEPGRVWVFELDAGTWSVVGGGFITALPLSNGDHFGASLAWIDDARLAVGAPGEALATGQVSIATLNAGETPFWSVTDLSTVASGPPPPADPTPPLGADDLLGYSVAFDDSPGGTNRLVAGAPGASRRYSWSIPSSGTSVGNPGLAVLTPGGNMGSAVDISGDLVVTGGISDTSEVSVNVYDAGAFSTNNTNLGTVVAGPLSNAVNDYLDIEGQNVAISRGGGGGRVDTYTINDLLTLDALDTFAPAATPGDLIGWSVDLEGRSLVAGAPGTDADSGAVFSTDVGVSSTWTAGASGGSFSDPANWDNGVVPGANDTAVYPGGAYTAFVTGEQEVAAVVVESPAELRVLDAAGDRLTITGGPSGTVASVVTGELWSGSAAGIVVEATDLVIDGTFGIGAQFSSTRGAATFAGSAPQRVSGTGSIENFGDLVVSNTSGPVEFDVASYVTSGSNPGASTTVEDGATLIIAPAYTENGNVRIGASAILEVQGAYTSTSDSGLEFVIAGESDSGLLQLTSAVPPDFRGAQVDIDIDLGSYGPGSEETVTIVSCIDCGSPDLVFGDVAPYTPELTPTSVDLVTRLDTPPPVPPSLERVNAVGDSAEDVAVDVFGNTLVAGSFSGSTGPGGLVASGDTDGYVASYDPSGALQWSAPFAASGPSRARTVVTDGDGNVYVAGEFEGTITFDPGGANLEATSLGADEGASNLFLAKYDVNGGFQWAEAFTGTADAIGPRLAVDPGFVWIASEFFNGTLDSSPGLAGDERFTSSSSSFVSRFGENGNFAGSLFIEGTGSVGVADISSDALGNLYAVGSFTGTVDSSTSAGSTDGWFAEIGRNVVISDFRTVGGVDADGLTSVVPSRFGSSVDLAGFVTGTVDVDPGTGETLAAGPGVILELDAARNLVSVAELGTSVGAIAVDSDDNVSFAANLEGSADIDPGPETRTVTSQGDRSVVVGQLDAAGDLAWGGVIGGTGTSQVNLRGLSVSPGGNVAVAGSFRETADFNPDPIGTDELTAAGLSDGFVLQLGGAADVGSLTGVVRDPAGNLLPGATVEVQPGNGSIPFDATGVTGRSDVTATDGSFTLFGLPLGSVVVTVTPPAGSGLAFEFYQDSFDPANAVFVPVDSPPLDIQLNELGTVSGTLFDQNSEPVQNEAIFATRFVPTVGWVQDGPAGFTDEFGNYSLDLAPGYYGICANPAVGSGLLGDCVPEGWTPSVEQTEGLLVSDGEVISNADLQFIVDNRAQINVTLLRSGGLLPATGNTRALAACLDPATPELSTALCSTGSSAVPAQFSPTPPFDRFSVNLDAGTYNLAGIVSADFGTATGEISDTTPLAVADGEEFNCTFTMNGPASCEVAQLRFTGAVDSDWGTAGNWNSGVVPVEEDEVVVPAGRSVVVDGNFAVGAVTVEGDITIGAGSTLTLTGGSGGATPSVIAAGGEIINEAPETLLVRADELVVDGRLFNGALNAIEFVGSNPQTVSGAGVIENDGIIRFDNPTTVTIEQTVGYLGGPGSSIEVLDGALDFFSADGFGTTDLGNTDLAIESGAIIELFNPTLSAGGGAINGTLDAAAGAEFDGNFVIDGGRLLGDVSFNGDVEFSGAISRIGGSILTDGATDVIDTSLLLVDGADIVNDGTWTWAITAGTTEIQLSGSGAKTFTNNGVFAKAGAGTVTFPFGFDFDVNNGAEVQVRDGTFFLAADGNWSGAAAAAGIFVTVNESGVFDWRGNQTLTGEFSGGSLPGSTPGIVEVSGIKTWAPSVDNSLDFVARFGDRSMLQLSGSVFDGAPFEIRGTAEVADDERNLTLRSSATVTPGAIIDLDGQFDLDGVAVDLLNFGTVNATGESIVTEGSTGDFINRATFDASPAGGALEIGTEWVSTITGTVFAQSGPGIVFLGDVNEFGRVRVQPGSTVEYRQAATFAPGSDLFNAGTVLAGGPLTLEDDATVLDGTLDGDVTVASGGSLTFIDDPADDVIPSTVNGSLTNDGSVLVDDVSIEFGPGATITNNGTWEWTSALSASRRDIVQAGSEPTFTNNGSFELVGSGALRINSNWLPSGASNLVVPFGGDLTIASDVTELGTVLVGAGSTIDYRGSINFGASSVLDIRITGPSTPGSFGSVSSQGAVTVDPAATLRTSTGFISPTPDIFDRYTILDCGASACPTFDTFVTDLGLEQSLVAGDLALTVPTAVPTFVNATGNSRWGDPLNWNPVGVPGANDSAVIPNGSGVTVDTIEAVADIDVAAGSLVTVTDVGALDLTGGPSGTAVSRLEGLLRYDAPSVINSSIDFAGGVLTLSADSGESTLSAASQIDFTGTGQVLFDGTVRKSGASPLTVAESVTWTAAALGNFVVDDGIADFAGDYVLDGATVIEPLATLVVQGDVTPGSGSVTIVLDGASSDNTFGQFSIRGNLLTNGSTPTNINASFVDPYVPQPSDVYSVIDCVDCGELSEIETLTGPLDLRIVADTPERIELFVDPCDTTFTGAGGDSLWGNPANWSDGVPTATSAACFEPASVVVAAGTTAEALRLEGDNFLVTIEGSLTLSEDSEFTGGLILGTTGSLNGTGEITVGSGTTMNVSGLVTAPLRNASDTFLDIRTGTRFSGAQVINDGQVLVLGDGFSLEDGATIVNNSQFVFLDDGSAPLTQTVTTSGDPSSFVNGGQIRVVAGVTAVWPAGLQVDFDEPTSILRLDIGGTAASGNFGRLVLDGSNVTLGANTVLNVRNVGEVDAPTVFDRYNVLDCGAADCPLFPIDFLEPGVQQFLVGGDIVLGLTADPNTFINSTGAWGEPSNWSNNTVPGATDDAFIPAGATVRVFGPGTTSVGSLTLAGSLDLDPAGTGARFEILGDSVIEATGSLFLTGALDSSTPNTNALALSGELQVDGSFAAFEQFLISGVDTLLARSTPVVELDAGASFSGDGLVRLLAQVVKDGPGTVTFGPDLDVSLEVDPTFAEVRGTIQVDNGTLDVQSAEPNGSFVADGTIAIGPGAIVNLPTGAALGAASIVDIGIVGPSSNVANYGRLVLPDGASAGTLSNTFTSTPAYTPSIFDRYPVVDCGAAVCSPFPTTVGSLGQVVVGGDIVLGLVTVQNTFINDSDANWVNPANWSTGEVPGPDDSVIIPLGVSVAVEDARQVASADVEGALLVQAPGSLSLDSVTIGPEGILRVRENAVLSASGDIDVQDGGQLSVFESVFDGVVDGTLDLDPGPGPGPGVRMLGDGLVTNNGVLRTNGPVAIGSGLTWNSGRNSLVDVQSGVLAVGATSFQDRGGFSVAPGARLTLAGEMILRPSSSIKIGIANDGRSGTINTQSLGFEPFDGDDIDETLPRIELDLVDGAAPDGPITIIECTAECANPPGGALAVDFDEFVTGDFDVIVGTDTIDVAVIENKYRGPVGATEFGSSVSVDGDVAVVGSGDGTTGPVVLTRSGGVWVVSQELTNGSSTDVSLDGDQFIADGILYEFDPDSLLFGAASTISGTSADLDGGLAVLGDGGAATAAVFNRSDLGTPLATLAPAVVSANYGAAVAVVDLGAGDALVAVSAPSEDTVYVFARSEGAWNTTPIRTLTSPDGGSNGFGGSIAISDTGLIVSEPTNDLPLGNVGAAWLYPIVNGVLADSPIKLSPATAAAGELVGVDVAIDGTIAVVGSRDGQALDFPSRNGVAYVFQFDGVDWVETDQISPPDGFRNEFFADSVSVSGTDVFVGSPRDRNSNGPTAGAAYSYEITPVEPAINTFTGTDLFASWNDPTNWSTGFVPLAGEEAIVPAGFSATVPAGSTAVIVDLTLDGTLDVDGTAWLGDAAIVGTGSVENSGTVLSNGASSIGPDLIWVNDVDSTVRVESGVLDIDDADYDTNGTLAVDAGARATVQNDWTAQSASVLEFEITGDASSTANFGQLDLPNGTLTAAGTIRTTFDGYTPVFDDVYALVTCVDCAAGTFGLFDVGVLDPTTSLRAITVRGPEVAPELTFGLSVAPGEDQVNVAPAGIAVNSLDREEIAAQGGGASNVAASSITEIGVEDTGIASISVGATPLSSIVLESVPLSSIPLVNIEIEDGWSDIVALWENIPPTVIAPDGTEIPNPQFADLSREPLSSLTFGQVLSVGDPTDPDTPAGRIAQAPLSSIDVEGTPLSSIPLSSIALGATPLSSIDVDPIGLDWCEIVSTIVPDCEPADLEQLTLMEITLRGVPLSSIPLSSIPLSSIPLDSIPLSSIPLSSIELGATPLSSIPLSSIPLSSIPLSSIEVGSLPLSSIPLSSIPLSSIPLSSIPLSSIPLSSIPLSSIDLSSTPLSSIPLSSIGPSETPLSSIPLSSIPLSSIPLSSIPLSSIPLSSIALADTPLSSIPLSSIPLSSIDPGAAWCEVLADDATGFDCTSGVDPSSTTLRELSLAGVPLSSIPLSSIPLSSIPLSSIEIGSLPLSSIPLSSIPLSSIPLSSIPLSSIPLSSIELGATPLSSIPLSSIPLSSIDVAGSPLSSIPLSSIPLSSIPLSSIPLSSIPLSSIPLSSIPLSSIPLSSIDVAGAPLSSIPLSSIPLSSIDVAASPLSSIPLSSIPLSSIGVDCLRVDCVRGTVGDAFARGAFPPATTLEDIQSATIGIRLGELAPFVDGLDIAVLLEGIATSGATVADLLSLDDMTLGDIAAARSVLADVLLGDLDGAFDGLTFDDVANAIIDPATGDPVADGSVLSDIRDAVSNDDTDGRFLNELLFLGDFTVGDLLEAGVDLNRELTLGEIEPVLGFVTVQALEDALGIQIDLGTRSLGELTAEELSFLTLNDLVELAGDTSLGDLLIELQLAGALAGFTLGDLLLSLVDPASLTYGGVEFAQVDVAALPSGTVSAATFSAQFTMTASVPRPVELEVALPTSASFVPGSSTIDGIPSDPQVDGRKLTWTVPAEPGDTYDIDFDVLPSLRLGATSLNASARIVGTGVVVPGSAQVTVAEGLEPNDFLPEVVEAEEDFVYLTYISSADDYDVFAIDVDENDVLVAELSNLDADLDLVLWGEVSAESASAALTDVSNEEAIIPILDPDADAADSESGDDFPRLDEIITQSGLPDLPELTLVSTSNGPGTENEFLKSPRLADGRYYFQVYGANGAVNVDPAALQLKILEADERPICRDIRFLPGTENALFGSLPTQAELDAANTLILLNESRLERLYGAAGRQTVVAAANDLVAYLSDPVNSLLGIDAVVVSVDAYESVRQAYADFEADSCVPAKANDIVAEINRTIIDPLRDNLEHVAILGGDELIPMARLEDATTVANEYDYRAEFDGDIITGVDSSGNDILSEGRTALTAAAWDSMILSDEPYGDSAARSLGDRFLYVTDVALGRVVETPQEIADALLTFETFGGQLDIETAAVLGYDFLSDGSTLIADELSESALGEGNVDRELAEGLTSAGAKWDKDDATDKLIQEGTQALVSLNAHFDHYRALPALGDQVPNFNDNLIATAVESRLGPGALTQSLIFSMGCHSGLSVSDITIGRTDQDWAQTLGRQGALYIGNTGFGYGDTQTVAYTEQLMALFADEVTSPLDIDGTSTSSSTVGQALAWAKNRYVAELQSFSVYDEKALMESTFYGLPFYQVGGAITPAPLPPAPTNTTVTDVVTELPSLGVVSDVNIVNEPVPVGDGGADGTYFRNVDADGVEQVIVAPGRPIQPKVVTDISVVGSDTTQLAQVARGAVVTEMTSEYQSLPNPVIATPVFDEGINQPEPEVPGSVFPLQPLEIVTTTGASGTRQTLVQATGQYRGETGVQRLDSNIETLVYYSDPDETDVIAPTIAEVSSTVAGGQLRVTLKAGRSGAADLVERVLVLVAQDPVIGATIQLESFDLERTEGTNVWSGEFDLDATTSIVEFQVQAVDQAGNVGYASNKTEGYPASVAADPAVTDVVAPADPVDLADGVTVTVEFTDPTGVFDSYDATFDWGDGSTSGSLVEPPSGTTPGTATATRTYEEPGRYDVTVTVTDGSGATATSIVEAIVFDPDAPPVIGEVELEGVVGIGENVDLSAAFTDGSAPQDTYTATVDWGDGTDEPAGLVGPESAQESGTIDANHVYDELGSYAVTLTVSDGSTTTSSQFSVVVNDPNAVPAIDGELEIVDLVEAGEPVTATVGFTDASSPANSYTATVDWGDGSTGDGDVTPPAGPLDGGQVTSTTSYTQAGLYPVTVTLVDDRGNTLTSPTVEVRVFDPSASPSITTAPGPITAPLGDAVSIEVSYTDRSLPVDSFTATIDWGDGPGEQEVLAADIVQATVDGDGTVSVSNTYSAAGTYQALLTIIDEDGNETESLFPITIAEVDGDPFITDLSGPTTPQLISDGVTIDATFTDDSAATDTYTATIDWGDFTESEGTVVPPSADAEGTVTATHVYAEPGVYTVTLTVADAKGADDTRVFEFVVVYDPSAGRVSGSGLFWSGPEARSGGPRWGSPAFFGYNARYKGDAEVPSGRTQLRLVGDFFFRSTSYDYLIINDAMAVAEGVGKIGRDEYRFRVQGIDNGWLDFFQITIWDPAAPDGTPPIYDNGMLFDKGDVVLLGGIRVRSR